MVHNIFSIFNLIILGLFTSLTRNNYDLINWFDTVTAVKLADQFKIISGLSHPFLGMGPGPMELGKLAVF